MNNYKPTIGMEVHVELATSSKMFCDCPNDPFEAKPNTNICPICLGMPGTLPVINKKALEMVIKIGLSLSGEISQFTKWDRKNYFYPDLPKGYQISQYDLPLVNGGFLQINDKKINIRRIHLEEDTGKLIHPRGKNYSLIDYNRAGVPLMELVTEPDITCAKDAKIFCQQLQLILRHLNISDADMEKGQMRAEANISVSKDNAKGTKVEIKNLNSFRSVERSILYEIERQTVLLKKDEKVVQETRGWNSDKGITYSQRLKETEADYRYFPEPDLPPLEPPKIIKIDKIRTELPKLPFEIQQDLREKYDISIEQAYIIVSGGYLEYFEELAQILGKDVKSAVTWMIDEKIGTSISLDNLAGFIQMLKNGEISGKMGKEIVEKMISENKSAPQIITEGGLRLISDEEEILELAKKVILENPQAALDFKKGKESALRFLVGQIMKKSRGQVNPQSAQKILEQELKR